MQVVVGGGGGSGQGDLLAKDVQGSPEGSRGLTMALQVDKSGLLLPLVVAGGLCTA